MNEQDVDWATIQIAGRAALPVRVIPFITHWLISPDELASQLARQCANPFDKLRNTHAYHMVGEKPVRVRAAEWHQVVSRLEALEAKIRRETPHEQPLQDPEGYERWSQESVSALPAGVFVWREEFVRDFDDDRDRVRGGFDDSLDQAISFAPMALRDPQVAAVVFAGFADPPIAVVSGFPPVSASVSNESHAERPKSEGAPGGVIQPEGKRGAATGDKNNETREARQERRLLMCEEEGLVFSGAAPGTRNFRLPHGIGDVAKKEGVTRQTFSADVKAALDRRRANRALSVPTSK